MRKTTSKLIKLSDQVKKPTIIKAKRVVKPEISLQSEINKAIADMETDDKESELLRRELAKPMKQRNQALMQKHSVIDGSNLTDNYPTLNNGVYYAIEMQFPEDDGVELKNRPQPWWVGLTIEHKNNTFSYRFPIQIDTYIDGQRLYKLDGFNVYVDQSGYIKDTSDYTIFQALTDYHAGNLRDGLVNDMFYKYKIINEDDIDKDILNDDVSKNFAIKGHNIYVTSKVIKNNVPAEIESDFKIHDVPILQDYQISKTVKIEPAGASGKTIFQREIKRDEKNGGVEIPGLTTSLPSGLLTLTQFNSVKTVVKSTRRSYILDYNPGDSKGINLIVYIGPSKALAYAKGIDSTVTRTEFVSWLANYNRSIYEQFSSRL